MANKLMSLQSNLSAALVLLVAMSVSPILMADDFSTLFTTAQERRLIDSNRYKVEQPEQVQTVVVVEEEVPEVQPVLMAEISSEYRISGITLSDDGAHSVWVNGMVYESGDTLEDGSTVQVLSDSGIRASIVTPDGGRHVALAGETIQVTYQVPVTDQ